MPSWTGMNISQAGRGATSGGGSIRPAAAGIRPAAAGAYTQPRIFGPGGEDTRSLREQLNDPLEYTHVAGVGYTWVPRSWQPKSPTADAELAGQRAGAAVKAFQTATGATSGFGPGGSSSASGASGPSIPRIGGSTTTTGGAGTGVGGAGSLPDTAAINAQAQQAQDAALARAKENAGLISRSALTGLHEALGERQMLGSGAEAQATGDVAMKGAGLINDVNVAGLDKQSNLAQRLAELSYTGRGQDINRELGNLNAQVAQRGQDVTMRGQDYSREAAQQGQYYNETSMLLNALKNLVY